MPALWLLFAITLFSGMISHLNQSSTERILSDSSPSIIAGNLLIYKNAVSSYASSNPTFTGQIPTAALNLPTWFRPSIHLGNLLQAGRVYVFYAGPDAPGLASELYKRTQSLSVGKNANGAFVSTASGITGLSVPQQIPMNATVLIQ